MQIFFTIIHKRITRHVLLGSGNILFSETFLTGLNCSLTHFLNARTVANIGVALQHPIRTAIIAERFDGKAIGIHYGFAYVGKIIGPLSMTFLAVTVGWRNTLFIFSIPVLIVGLIVI